MAVMLTGTMLLRTGRWTKRRHGAQYPLPTPSDSTAARSPSRPKNLTSGSRRQITEPPTTTTTTPETEVAEERQRRALIAAEDVHDPGEGRADETVERSRPGSWPPCRTESWARPARPGGPVRRRRTTADRPAGSGPLRPPGRGRARPRPRRPRDGQPCADDRPGLQMPKATAEHGEQRDQEQHLDADEELDGQRADPSAIPTRRGR